MYLILTLGNLKHWRCTYHAHFKINSTKQTEKNLVKVNIYALF